MDALGGVIPASNCTLAPYKRVELAAEPASAAERAVAKELGSSVRAGSVFLFPCSAVIAPAEPLGHG